MFHSRPGDRVDSYQFFPEFKYHLSASLYCRCRFWNKFNFETGLRSFDLYMYFRGAKPKEARILLVSSIDMESLLPPPFSSLLLSRSRSLSLSWCLSFRWWSFLRSRSPRSLDLERCLLSEFRLSVNNERNIRNDDQTIMYIIQIVAFSK